MNDQDRLPLSICWRRSTAAASCAASCAPALLWAAAAAALPLATSHATRAQVQDERPQQTPLEQVGDPDQGASLGEEAYGTALSISAGSTFTTEYWFRGILQENRGFIAQPYMELGVGLFAPEESSHRVDAHVGIWNSFHSEKTGAAAGPSTWYESDLYGGVALTTDDLEIGLVYTFYTSPSGAFDTIQEIGLYTGYTRTLAGDADRGDDLDVTLGLGGGVFFETADRSGTEDAYAELNVEPGLGFEVGDGTPISVTFPVAVGFSLDDYYVDATGDDEPLGYVSAAVAVGVPLPVPARYGQWQLSGALTGVFLGADSLTAISGAEDANVFGSLSLDISN